ncbi:MAG: 2-C-methyl-D-erythritol 2,4-cyclodiphosphate synthase [Ginsengibacter sp.]
MQQLPYRTGFGIDFHQLVAGRELWIGGIKLAHHKGALGHSDADVLLHAICDAMLGAVCLGDIGVHFPDTDQSFKDIDSKILLEKSYSLVKETGYLIGNIDATVCLEFPKLKPHSLQMRETIAGLLNISLDQISIKATTSEKMGFVGREEGISAFSTVLLMRDNNQKDNPDNSKKL